MDIIFLCISFLIISICIGIKTGLLIYEFLGMIYLIYNIRKLGIYSDIFLIIYTLIIIYIYYSCISQIK